MKASNSNPQAKSQFVARTPLLFFAVGFTGFCVLFLIPREPCGCGGRSRSTEVVDQLRTLGDAVERFGREQGAGSLADQRAVADYLSGSFSLKDPWGTEIQFRASSYAGSPTLELRSAGPDLVFGSSDSSDDYYRFLTPKYSATAR